MVRDKFEFEVMQIMIAKVNLKEQAHSSNNLFEYKGVDSFNNHMMNVLQVENRTWEFNLNLINAKI